MEALADGFEYGIARKCSGKRYMFLAHQVLLRKEVIQPHVPVRLPCYDLAPITSLILTTTCSLHPWVGSFRYY